MTLAARAFRGFLPVTVILLCLLTACSSSTAPGDTIAIVRLSIGEQTVLIDRVGGPRSAASIPATGSVAQKTQFTVATFHRSDGTPIALDPTLHEVRLDPVDTGVVTFTRTEPFRGNLFRVAAGATLVTVTVVNIRTGDVPFGPHPFALN